MTARLRALARIVRAPVSPETRQRLADAWARLPDPLRTPNQFLGRQYAGCGATIGAMPRCDFACRGCYLGDGANRVPAEPVAAIKRQLDRLRAWLGEGGNVQLPDGEVILRPEAEVIELVRYARGIGLVPMLMTHGDAFRRDPELLSRLMVTGGLSEVSIHVDVTQRGRRGAAYRHATREVDLLPLRDEFAALIRRARRMTRRPLEAATTMTVTNENLAEVPLVIRWMCGNSDAFKMISFQPVADVGRTAAGLGGMVEVEDLWTRIAEGLSTPTERLRASQGSLGHPGCSRFAQGLVVRRDGERPRFHPLLRPDDAPDHAVIQEALARFGGLTMRLDDGAQALARALGLALAAPRFVVGRMLPFVARWPRRLDPGHPMRLIWQWLRGRTRIDYLNIVSHHFMSRAELLTPLGRERVGLCVFKVPIGDELVSMCEVNALGGRDRYYESLRGLPAHLERRASAPVHERIGMEGEPAEPVREVAGQAC